MKNIVVFAFLALCGCGGDAFGTGSAFQDGGPAGDSAPDAVLPDTQPDAVVADAADVPDTGLIHVAAPDAGSVDTGVVVADAGAGDTGSDAGSVDTGVVVADAGCTLVTHNNGVGQTWQDCVPAGTYSTAQAIKACEAHYGTSAHCSGGGCVLSGNVPNQIIEGIVFVDGQMAWGVDMYGAGHVYVAATASSRSVYCPGPSDPTWN